MSGASVPMIFEGLPNVLPPGTRVGIAVARWNEPITRRLLAGAVHRLEAAGLPAAAVDVAWVPGSFELPLAADRLAATGRYAAILCLGAIIKGETSHDHHIATATAAGIEATARGRGYAGNKGAECAAAAAEMVALLFQIVSAGGRS